MDNHFFVAPWNHFMDCYPSVAAEYMADNQQCASECATIPDVVFYYISTDQIIISLDDYKESLANGSYVAIILAPFAKAHIVDALGIADLTVHLVVKHGSYCLYEQDMVQGATSSIKRESVVTVYEDATSDYYVLYGGKASIDHNYQSSILGRNGQASLRGIFCATKQKIVIKSEQRHIYPSTHSEVSLNGFATDNASIFYKGLITIGKDAKNTVARQEHKTLLLSSTASVESVPILEVSNKEVRCSHASAIGMLDESVLLYLQSRGLSKKQARQLFLMSYVQSIYKLNQKLLHIGQKISFIVNSFDFL